MKVGNKDNTEKACAETEEFNFVIAADAAGEVVGDFAVVDDD